MRAPTLRTAAEIKRTHGNYHVERVWHMAGPPIHRSYYLPFSHSLGLVFIYPTNIYQASTMYQLDTGPGAGGPELSMSFSLSKLGLTICDPRMLTDYICEAQMRCCKSKPLAQGLPQAEPH